MQRFRQLTNRPFTYQAAGFSLIELMLALLLGLVVIGGVVQMFVANSRTYSTLNAQARMQENGRFALQFIAQSTRSAGFFGCDRDREVFGWTLDIDPAMPAGDVWPEFDVLHPVWGYPDSMATTLLGSNFALGNSLAGDASELQPGSDILVVRAMRTPAAYLERTLQPVGTNISADIILSEGAPAIVAGDVVVIGACDQTVVVQANAASPVAADQQTITFDAGSGLNGSELKPLDESSADSIAFGLSLTGRSYGSDAIVGPLESIFYFIRKSRLDQKGNQIYGLWEKRGTAAAQELVEGVQDLKLLFAVDNDLLDGVASVDQYVAAADLAAAASDPRQIVAVRVTLTATSVEEGDGVLLSRTYTQTTQIRNANPER